MSNQQKQFGIGRSILFSFILIILIAIIIEFSSFIILKIGNGHQYQPTHASKLPEHQFHPFLGWLSTPNLSVNTTSPCGPVNAYINTDENGYSIVPLAFSNPDITIVITGGSTMFGVGQSDNTGTIPSRLAEIIHKRLGIKANVINLGQRGYRSFQEMNILNDWYAHGNRADLVIAISGANDAIMGFAEPAIDNVLVNRSIWHGAVKLARRAEGGNMDQPLLSIHLNWDKLADMSHFFTLVNRIRNKIYLSSETSNIKLAQNDHPVPYENIAARTNAAISHYAAMSAIAKQHGAYFIFMLQPTFFSKKAPTNQESVCTQKSLANAGGMNDQYGPYEIKFFDSLHKAKKNYNYIDLRHSLDNINTSSYIDNVHYNSDASSIIAESIYQIIKPEIFKITKRHTPKAVTS